MRCAIACLAGCVLALAHGFPAPRAAEDPTALVRAYFASAAPAARASLAARLASHPDYRPARLRAWLHRGAPFPELPAGVHQLAVDVGGGEQRRVSLVVPEGYRADTPWPLIYALHPSGEPPDAWALQVQGMLGSRARSYVIASPEYTQNYIAAKPPFVAEHPAILDAVARRVHVDASRVYAFGYSKGGFAAWFVALYYPDRLASAVSLAAGFDVAPADDGLWKLLVRNVAHVPVFNSWGEHDPLTVQDIAGQPAGTFVESNRRFQREVHGMGLPIVNFEVAGGVHNQLVPPAEPIVRVISESRRDDPERLDHVFRHLHQASCYWLEGLSWVGEAWGDPSPVPAPSGPGEPPSAALTRSIEPLLGRLTGVRDGQALRITRRHIGDVVIWFGERSIDWSRSVTIEVDGKPVFRGKLVQDPGVALAWAFQTMDFDALRFAGIRVDASGVATVVTAAGMPDPAWRTVR